MRDRFGLCALTISGADVSVAVQRAREDETADGCEWLCSGPGYRRDRTARLGLGHACELLCAMSDSMWPWVRSCLYLRGLGHDR